MFAIQQEVNNEINYLSSIIQDGSLIDEAELSSIHFVKKEHCKLFEVLNDFKRSQKTIDIISLMQLSQSVLEQCGGYDYVSKLALASPSLNAFKRYEEQIINHFSLRTAKKHAQEFLNEVDGTNDLATLEKLIERINKIDTPVKTEETFKELLVRRLEEHDNQPAEGLSGVDTGFEKLNSLIDGWQPSDLIVVGARPSMGKTAFLLNSGIMGQSSNIFINLFSIEMSPESIVDRMIAIVGDINLMKMRNPNKRFTEYDRNQYSKALGIINKMRFDIKQHKTVPEIRATVRRNMMEFPNKKHVVMIDYLTLMKTNGKQTRNNEIEEIVIDLKGLATDLKIPVIVLAQLSRGIESRENKRPTLSDLRDSGAIEQAADLVMFLYRDDYYDPKTKEQGKTEVIIAKNRNGALGKLEFHFNKKSNRFEEWRCLNGSRHS